METLRNFREKTKDENFEQSHCAKNITMLKNITKNKAGALLAFPTSIQLQNIKQIKKKIRKRVSQSRKKERESLIVPKQNGKGAFGMVLEWFFRGFGCVQNQVLSTFGKNAQCTKSGIYRVRSVV